MDRNNELFLPCLIEEVAPVLDKRAPASEQQEARDIIHVYSLTQNGSFIDTSRRMGRALEEVTAGFIRNVCLTISFSTTTDLIEC